MISAIFFASGENIRVRPRHENDREWFFSMRSNPEYQKFLAAGNTLAGDLSPEPMLRRRATDYMTIVSCRSDVLVGCAALTAYPSNEWKVDVFIDEQYRRLHFGSEVYWLLIRRAIEGYSASSVLIEFQPHHKASLSLARFFYDNDAGSVSNDNGREGYLVFKLSRQEYFRVMDSVAKKLEAHTLQ